MNLLDLAAYIDQELTDNPVLEIDDSSAASDQSFELPAFPVEDTYEDDQDSQDPPSMVSWEDRLANGGPSLRESVLSQIRLSTDDPQLLNAASYVVSRLDESGYLDCDTAEMLRDSSLPVELLEAGLLLVQSQDPPGVGARNLQECLLIQIERRGLEGSIASEIVRYHLKDLASGRLQALSRSLSCTMEEVLRAARLIRSLDPRPGQKVSANRGYPCLIPDATVERVRSKAGTEFVVVMNDNAIPRLRISREYSDLRKHSPHLSDVRSFLDERMFRATWLLKCLEYRRTTLYRVIEAITREQAGFFLAGQGGLVPLTQRKLAEALGISESTVSRAVTGKAIDTPYGLRELKDFFQAGVGAGDSVAASRVKALIREFIDSEPASQPLSDHDISRRLAGLGMPVSRRTVAKYREREGILPSGMRRRPGE